MKFLNKFTTYMCGHGHTKVHTERQKIKHSIVLTSVLAMASYSAISTAAVVSNPISGEVERIIVNEPTNIWSGGTIVVGGMNVIVPANMVIDLPANRLTLQQFFTNAPSACAAIDANADGIPDQTGLAKADSCNTSFTGASVTIDANRMDSGDIIAGYIMLEKATELVSGIVSYVNYDEGYFRVDGIPGDAATGAMVRVNDPEGRHTEQSGAGCVGSGPNCSADTRYGVDPDNYTFTGSTGYPMCIPSTVARGPYNFDVNRDGVIDPGPTETGLTAVAAVDGTGDLLCPQSNRGIDPVTDSRLFAPIQVGDHLNAEGNFENIGGVIFLSAHTVGVSVGLTTDDTPFQPDYIVFDEVGWDVPGYQNQRVRDLLIGFSTLPNPGVDIFGLYSDPATNSYQEVVFATTVGCDLAAGAGTCSTQGVVGNTGIFKVVHDVDFINGVPIGARQSPCQHLNAAVLAGGIPAADGTMITTSRCSPTPTMAQEFSVLSPATRDIIGRSRHKHALNPTVVTLDFHGTPSQNGEYLNPVAIGHPEFVEIDLNALQTPLIFAGEQWNMDRRLGPGGCDGVCETPGAVPIGDPSMQLNPFPYSELDPGTQAGVPGVPFVPGYGDQKGRTLTYWPLTPAEVLPYPPVLPVPQGIVPTQHAALQCTLLSGIDTDLDGIDDALDNCTNVENGTLLPLGQAAISQRDTDGDGYGNMCDADINGDNTVNAIDYGQFRNVWLNTAPGVVPYTTADHMDFNGDGVVNAIDYGTFRNSWLSAPGPSALAP